MNDLISRKVAIDDIETVNPSMPLNVNWVKNWVKTLPSAQPGQDEWCTDCKEYDPEKHCCPRFNRVIRNALKDAQPEPKKGKWIDMGDFEQCSACTGTHLKEINTVYGKAIWIKSAYCPNCGAKMEV